MNCPMCGNGEIEANAGSRSLLQGGHPVFFECTDCDFCTESLTELFEHFREQLLSELKEETL